MNPIIIFLIGLLIPTSKPCLPALTAELSAGLSITCLQSLPVLEPKLKFANFFLRSKQISDFLTLTYELKPFPPHLDYLLGTKSSTTYLVLLQNDREMRANGGFFGSYAKIILSSKSFDSLNPRVFEFSPQISFHDIYVPDGALVGHVDPPAPIQTAFKQGWFRLRDSDWEPDFPTAAKTIRWFFEKGNEIDPDFLITLNLTTIEKIMAVVGEVDVPEFNFKLNSDNLYTLLQNQAEINFFPGSTQKQNVLTAVGSALAKKISSLKSAQFLQISRILLDQLNHTNLLVNSTNPDIQEIILAKKWGGEISAVSCQSPGCLADSVLLVEANLGANKANCCVDRLTTHTITKGETEITHLIQLTFTNTSPLENPLPPRFYGGNYISYLRYYLPENARNIRLTAQPTLPKTLSQYPAPFDGINQKTFDYKISNFKCAMSNEQCQMKEIGFFHTTAAGTKSAIQLSYDLPLDNNPTSYQLTLLKQNGFEKSPAEINLFGQSHSTDLTNNFSVNTPL